jgi:hypothetical protein
LCAVPLSFVALYPFRVDRVDCLNGVVNSYSFSSLIIFSFCYCYFSDYACYDAAEDCLFEWLLLVSEDLADGASEIADGFEMVRSSRCGLLKIGFYSSSSSWLFEESSKISSSSNSSFSSPLSSKIYAFDLLFLFLFDFPG